MSKKDDILKRLSSLSKAKGGGKKFDPKDSIYAEFDRSKKNEYLFLPFKSTITKEDPVGDIFKVWKIHTNILENPKKEIHAWSNFLAPGEKNPCPIAKAIVELKKDFMTNMPIWKPIEEKEKFVVPVINLSKVEEGVKWFSYKVSVLRQLENEITNMEDEELLFWDLKEPKKVIITFDKDAPAATMYAVSIKPIKDKELLKTIAAKKDEWIEQCVELTDILKNHWDIEKREEIIEAYLVRKEEELKGVQKKTEEDLDELADDDDDE